MYICKITFLFFILYIILRTKNLNIFCIHAGPEGFLQLPYLALPTYTLKKNCKPLKYYLGFFICVYLLYNYISNAHKGVFRNLYSSSAANINVARYVFDKLKICLILNIIYLLYLIRITHNTQYSHSTDCTSIDSLCYVPINLSHL